MAEKEKEIAEVVIKVTTVNGKERYEVIARRSNYVEITSPDNSTIQKELEKVVGLCKVLKTPDEKLEQQTERLLEFVIKNSTDEQKAKNPEFFRDWKEGLPFTKGEYINYAGLVFYCKETHTAKYSNMPLVDFDFWKQVTVEKQPEKKINPEWEQNFKNAQNYYRDLSYNKNDYVIYYNELYKAVKDVKNGEQPHEKSSYWEHIPKKIV